VVQSSDVSASFFFRERSISLIYFADLTHDAMPELLDSSICMRPLPAFGKA
jgi:hypothetical protein